MCDGCHAHPLNAKPAACVTPAEPLTGEEQEQLERLIADQQRDDESARAPRHRHEIPATDLDGRTTRRNGRHEAATGQQPNHGWRMLERAVDHRCSPRAWQDAAIVAMDDAASAAVKSGGENRAGRASGPTLPTMMVGEGMIWGASVAGYRPEGGPCPACSDALLPVGWLCLCCHATRDRPVRWPMKAVEVKPGAKRKRAKRKRAKRKRAKTAT
jgi:hypothetical protein